MVNKRRYQDVADALVDRIKDGGFQPGDRFPTERQIAEEMQISRSLVREAYIMLEIQGHLEVRKGSGSYVCPPPLQKPQPLARDTGPFEMLQARQALESTIATIAATTVTKSDITTLRHILSQERAAIDAGRDGGDFDRQFHCKIAEATQNSVFAELVENLWLTRDVSPMWDQLHSRITDQDYRRQWLVDHEAILEALKTRDADGARRAMWQHLENVRTRLLDLSDPGDPDFDGYLFPAPARPGHTDKET